MNKKYKLIIAAVATVALAAFVLAGCSSSSGSSSATASSSAASGERTQLVVGFDQEYPPYGYVGEDGEYTGFDLELAKEVCARNGWEFVAQPINWDTKLEELNAGAFDCIWNGFTMEGREADYAFSAPYMDNGQVILVKTDSPIQTFADLADKVVATQVDSAAYELLAGEDAAQADLYKTFKNLEERATFDIAVTELDAGAFDAMACDLSIAAYYMSKDPGKYRILDEYLSQEHYAVAFRTDDTALADTVTATLKDMVSDGFVEELCGKYAEYGISFDNWVLK